LSSKVTFHNSALLPTQINDALLLNNNYFDNSQDNIDYLVECALNESDIENALKLLLSAADACEKFHSYFHFEESFFYMTYGDFLLSQQRADDAITQYKLSILQYPLNSEAHTKMIEVLIKNKIITEAESSLSRAKSLNITNQKTTPMSRPFKTFVDYVGFATNTNKPDTIDVPDFWLSFENYQLMNDEKLLNQTIERVKQNHLLYHHNAAKIYYNCSVIYDLLGQKDFSKNALIKSRNLDISLTPA